MPQKVIKTQLPKGLVNAFGSFLVISTLTACGAQHGAALDSGHASLPELGAGQGVAQSQGVCDVLGFAGGLLGIVSVANPLETDPVERNPSLSDGLNDFVVGTGVVTEGIKTGTLAVAPPVYAVQSVSSFVVNAVVGTGKDIYQSVSDTSDPEATSHLGAQFRTAGNRLVTTLPRMGSHLVRTFSKLGGCFSSHVKKEAGPNPYGKPVRTYGSLSDPSNIFSPK